MSNFIIEGLALDGDTEFRIPDIHTARVGGKVGGKKLMKKETGR